MNPEKLAELDRIYHELSRVKEKHVPSLIGTRGIHGVGIDTHNQLIVIYANEPNDEIPNVLDDIPTKIIIKPFPKVMIDTSDKGYKPDPEVASYIYTANVQPTSPYYNGTPFQFEYDPRVHKWGYHKMDMEYGRSVSQMSAGRWEKPTGYNYLDGSKASGTLGSWWWSKKHQRPVAITNNHVLGDGDQAVPRQKTPSFPFTYVGGGSAYTGEDYIKDKSLRFNGEWGHPYERLRRYNNMKNPRITSVTPSSAQAGQLVTIQGVNLGWRWGQSKVWFGDKEAIVKSWTYAGEEFKGDESKVYLELHSKTAEKGRIIARLLNEDNTAVTDSQRTAEWKENPFREDLCDYYPHYDCTIEVYVPEGAGNEIIVEKEGDIVTWYPTLYYRGNYVYTHHEIGNVIEIHPYSTRRPKNNATTGKDDPETIYTSYDYYGSDIDLTFMEAKEPRWVSSKIPMRPGRGVIYLNYAGNDDDPTPVNPYAYFPYHLLGHYYEIKDVYRGNLYTNMIVKKTGLNTGTTFARIEATNVTIGLSYTIDADVANSYDLVLLRHNAISFAGTDVAGAGDSGSSIVTASKADYLAYWNHYEQKSTTDTLDYLTDVEIIEVEENLFIGNLYGGAEGNDLGYCDNAQLWFDYYELAPLSQADIPYIEYTEATVKAITEGNIEIVVPPVSVYGELESVSSVEGNIKVLTVTHIPSVDLTAFVASEPTNLTLFGDHYELIGSVESQSSIEGQLTIPLFLSGQIDSVSSVDGSILLAISPILLSGEITVQSSVEGIADTFYNTLFLSGEIQGISEITGSLYAPVITLQLAGEIVSTSLVEGSIFVAIPLDLIGEIIAVSEVTGSIRIVGQEPVIGEIILQGNRILNIVLQGDRILHVILEGGLDVTATNRNFEMFAGDTKNIRIPLDFLTVEERVGLSAKWALKRKVSFTTNNIYKTSDVNGGITITDTEIIIRLEPTDTLELGGTSYYHECEITDGQGNVSTITTGQAQINKTAV